MKIFHIIFFLVIYALFGFTNRSFSDSLLLHALESGDIQTFSEYLDKGVDVNGYYGDDELTLLAYSIRAGQASIAELLIQKGADAEQISDRKTPLMFAAKYNRAELVPLLISSGANINSVNHQKNSALHYAAKYGNLEIIKIFCDKGASLNLLNDEEWTPMDYAIISNRKDIEDFLESRGGRIYNKTLPSFSDGPYMEITKDERLKVSYLVHDSVEQKSQIISELHDFDRRRVKIDGIGLKKSRYRIDKEFNPPPSEYENVSRILAIGDIHGEYSRMIMTLKNAGVIDDNLEWKWGDGHLVFTGDIFDRENDVTECLWFIYGLEKQAVRKHGKVHFLLGNHEVMILNGDLRYISNSYYGITTNLDLDYSRLYNKNTVLGRWLRSKNTIEKINELIFVHAGISPQFLERNISIDSANCAIRAFLNGDSVTYPQEFYSFLSGNFGPVWYRGYTNKSRYYSKITPEQLSEVLSAFNVETIVVGHTETDSIKSLYNSKVIDINIPLWNDNVPEQALLIEDDRFYVIKKNGNQKQLNQLLTSE